MAKNKNSRALRMLVATGVIATILVWACSQGGAVWNDIPVFTLCVMIAFVIQWIVFVPSYIFQTEHFYDLTGSLTYITLIVCVWQIMDQQDLRAVILSAMVLVWAIRLGSFLFIRISKDGSDNRFDEIKPNIIRFFTAWTVQGLWVSVTLAAALMALTTTHQAPIGWLGIIGISLWCVGFIIEVVADYQKRVFRAKLQGNSGFITTGLWAHSRHPNYFGEIMLWLGVSLLALPVMEGWQHVSMISPVFVLLLLTRVSGIPTLEKTADKRWQGHQGYEQYKAQTPVLVPRLTKPESITSMQS